MLLSPTAARRLKDVTAYTYWPYTTHAQRNELARMFNEEAARLLDQKAESTIKRAVELYSGGEISYERYMELIEEVSKEEAARGAAYGEAYARNRVFEFAQKALDRAKDQAHALSLADAQRQYEVERQKTEQSLKEVVQRYIAEVQTITQQHDAELKTITQEQKEELLQNQGEIIEQTRAAIEQIIVKQLQEERTKRVQEIREEEARRPAREAARRAMEHVAALEQRIRTHKRLKGGLIGLGFVFLGALIILLLFSSLPQWGTALTLIVIVLILAIASLWKSPIPEDKVAAYRREIALFQTQSGDYASLSEEERSALLAQRIL